MTVRALTACNKYIRKRKHTTFTSKLLPHPLNNSVHTHTHTHSHTHTHIHTHKVYTHMLAHITYMFTSI